MNTLHVLYWGTRIFVGKFAEEDGRKVLNDACEARTIVIQQQIQEQVLMIGKIYINGDILMAQLSPEAIFYKLYVQVTSGLKLV